MKGRSIGLVSTLGTNIGDDLIRQGVLHLLKQHFGVAWEPVVINKHRPWSVTPWWHPERLHPLMARLPVARRWLLPALDAVSDRMWRTKLDPCDLLIQCGTPVFWKGCGLSPWTRPLWCNTLLAQAARSKPVLNLAAGSCYGWRTQPARAEDLGGDREFVRRVAQGCTLHTVRDTLAQRILAWSGAEAALLPCAALLAARAARGKPAVGAVAGDEMKDRILVNYMPGAGHYDFDGSVQAQAWSATFLEVLARLRRVGKVAFLCHDEREKHEAEKLRAADEPCVMPRSAEEYFAEVRGARAAFCNRLHASVALAGAGIPSVAAGNDTRILMVRTLGLPAHHAGEATAEVLAGEMERVIHEDGAERERLTRLADAAEASYLKLLSGVPGLSS